MAIMRHVSYIYSKHRTTLLVGLYLVAKYACGDESEKSANVIIK